MKRIRLFLIVAAVTSLGSAQAADISLAIQRAVVKKNPYLYQVTLAREGKRLVDLWEETRVPASGRLHAQTFPGNYCQRPAQAIIVSYGQNLRPNDPDPAGETFIRYVDSYIFDPQTWDLLAVDSVSAQDVVDFDFATYPERYRQRFARGELPCVERPKDGNFNYWSTPRAPLPSLVPDNITTQGLLIQIYSDEGSAQSRALPDGRLYINGYSPNLILLGTIQVPLSPEIVKRYFIRFRPIPLEEQKALIDPDTGRYSLNSSETRDALLHDWPLLVDDYTTNSRTGPYYNQMPGDTEKNLAIANCTADSYHGPNAKLAKALKKETRQLVAAVWQRACTPQEIANSKKNGENPTCGANQNHSADVVFAVLKKLHPKSHYMMGLEPLPKTEWKYIDCKFYITWEEQLAAQGENDVEVK